MNINFTYKPLPVHVPFHRSTVRNRCMFGAFGSGKSYAVLSEAIAWCLEQPGIRGVCARKTIPELRDATEPIFLELLPPELLLLINENGGIKRTGGHIERIIFPNGSEVLFRSIDDAFKWRSLNLGFIAIDEMNELSEDEYNEIASRVRQRDITAKSRALGYTNEITRQGIWGATNPAGHDWCYRNFHPESPVRKKDHVCFTSTTLDNPYLPPSYVEAMLNMPRPYIARYVMCQFDDFAGRIYDTWGPEHLVKNPSMTPERWRQATIWQGFDPGTRAPSAAVWVWFDPDRRRLVVVGDYEEPGLSVDQHAANWKLKEAKNHWRPAWRTADGNAITARDRGTMRTLQSQFAKRGFHFTLASNNEQQKWQLGSLIGRNQFVCSEAAIATYEAIRDYQWVDLTPVQRSQGIEGAETVLKRNTHLVEASQYVAARQLPKQRINPYEGMDDRDAFNYDIHRQLKKENRARLRSRTTGTHDLGQIKL